MNFDGKYIAAIIGTMANRFKSLKERSWAICSLCWRFLGDNSTQIQLMVGLVAGIFILWQYLEYKKEVRIDRSLEYLRRHREEKLLNARIEIEMKWLQNENYLMFKENPNYNDKLLNNIYNKMRYDSHYIKNFHILHTFYIDAATCLLSGVCDEVTICKPLFGDVYNLKHRHSKYIEYWNETMHINVEYYLDSFIKRCSRPDSLFVFEDNSLLCQSWIYMRQIFNFESINICKENNNNNNTLAE